MRFRRIAKLWFASVLERLIGLPFVIQAERLPRHPVPWYFLEVELGITEVSWLIHASAHAGAREDVLFLNEVLERMLAA